MSDRQQAGRFRALIDSRPAVVRAARASVVLTAILAGCTIGNAGAEFTSFAVFGTVAVTMLASFGGTRTQVARAYVGLTVAGCVLCVIGSAISDATVLVAVVAFVVGFVVFFLGVLGPNVRGGATAVLVLFVLPAASTAGIEGVGARLGGWLCAAVVGTLAVLLTTTTQTGSSIAPMAADAIDAIRRALTGHGSAGAAGEAVGRVRSALRATPYEATHVAAADQAMVHLAHLLALLNTLGDATMSACAAERDLAEPDAALLTGTVTVLTDTASLLRGKAVQPDLDTLERLRQDAVRRFVEHAEQDVTGARPIPGARASLAIRMLALAARTVALDAFVATGTDDWHRVERMRREMYGMPTLREGWLSARLLDAQLVARHWSLRATPFQEALRGGLAIALSLTIARVAALENGFWVVLAALSVLRSTALNTGANAVRAVLGTTVGVVIGGAVVLSAGTDPMVLWMALPFATAIAAFAPRAWSFAAGQAAFTLMVCIVFNLIHPVGWRIGIVRAEDIAVGAAVSLVAGALLWPRGPAAMVADNIARLVRASTQYLEAAAAQCLGEGTITRAVRSRAISATTHVDDGLPALLDSPRRPDGTEQALTRLLGTTTLIRLTGHSLAVAVPTPHPVPAEVRRTVGERLRRLTTWFDIVAAHLVGGPAATIGPGRDPRIQTPEGPWAHWVELHLDLLADHLEGVDASAGTLAAARREWS